MNRHWEGFGEGNEKLLRVDCNSTRDGGEDAEEPRGLRLAVEGVDLTGGHDIQIPRPELDLGTVGHGQDDLTLEHVDRLVDGVADVDPLGDGRRGDECHLHPHTIRARQDLAVTGGPTVELLREVILFGSDDLHHVPPVDVATLHRDNTP